jgi:hypothetical protein
VLRKCPQVLLNSDVEQWCEQRLCTTREQFEAAAAATPNELIVLRYVLLPDSGSAGPQGALPHQGVSLSHVIVFSSPALLKNVVAALSGKREGVNLASDGTYKIALCGWVLIDIGTTSLYYNQGQDKWQHKFFPFLYIFCRTERADSIALGFGALRDCTVTFFGLPAFAPRVLQLDHSQAFVNAGREV